MISKEEKNVHHFKLPIEYLPEKKPKKMRKLVVSDIFDVTDVQVKYDNRHKKLRVKRYRQQQEYGEKKQIKP